METRIPSSVLPEGDSANPSTNSGQKRGIEARRPGHAHIGQLGLSAADVPAEELRRRVSGSDIDEGRVLDPTGSRPGGGELEPPRSVTPVDRAENTATDRVRPGAREDLGPAARSELGIAHHAVLKTTEAGYPHDHLRSIVGGELADLRVVPKLARQVFGTAGSTGPFECDRHHVVGHLDPLDRRPVGVIRNAAYAFHVDGSHLGVLAVVGSVVLVDGAGRLLNPREAGQELRSVPQNRRARRCSPQELVDDGVVRHVPDGSVRKGSRQLVFQLLEGGDPNAVLVAGTGFRRRWRPRIRP